MTARAVEVERVTKRFDSTTAVNAIDLTIDQGEFFSFLGPSGCGKTTLLRMIAGFEQPTVGRIRIAGQDMVGIPPHRRPVNMVFQSYALFPHLSVRENVCFGLRSRGKVGREELREKSDKALSMVRLQHLADRLPAQLSGGQQQRIALARAIINEPAVLLLDEPLSALDPQIREEMQSELARLQRELNMTFIMVTHDQGEALALSHRIAVFCSGNLEQVGMPHEVYGTPKTAFVAKFIGQSNIWEAIYTGSESPGMSCFKMRWDDDYDTTFSIATGPERGLGGGIERGAACSICLKPNVLKIQSATSSSESLPRDNAFRGRIMFASYKGTGTEYLVNCGKETIRIEQSALNSGLPLSAGDEVVISFSPDSACIISTASPRQSVPEQRTADALVPP